MVVKNEAIKILIENAKTFSERNHIYSLTESEELNVNNNMVAKLYDSVLKHAHIDFEDIPKTKGDVTKYSGYKSMIESLDIVRNISIQSGTKLKELEIIDQALSNIVVYRDVFEKGIRMNKDFIVLQYNTLVASCVMATSSLISSYVDYVKNVDRVEFRIINTKLNSGDICIKALDSFNKSVKSGDFSKVMNSIIKTGITENYTTVSESIVSALQISAMIIGGAILLINIIRNLVFYFYYSRMRLSDYLKMQAKFLELNKNNIAANQSGVPANKKNEIIKNQEKVIIKLNAWADKIRVDSKMTEKQVVTEIDKENSNWKISDIESSNAKTDKTGFQLL